MVRWMTPWTWFLMAVGKFHSEFIVLTILLSFHWSLMWSYWAIHQFCLVNIYFNDLTFCSPKVCLILGTKKGAYHLWQAPSQEKLRLFIYWCDLFFLMCHHSLFVWRCKVMGFCGERQEIWVFLPLSVATKGKNCDKSGERRENVSQKGWKMCLRGVFFDFLTIFAQMNMVSNKYKS